MKVLLIDDNVETSVMLSKFLGLKGYDCIVSNDGRNGLALINSNNFDVVLLDLSMPEFSGHDVIEQLCQSGKIKKNKIIVFTASSLKEEESKNLLGRGVRSVLQKPIELNLLTEALCM